MASSQVEPAKIAIIGAGFTGVALAAALQRYSNQPLEVYLFEKTNEFGAGDAYRTPFPYHLLNARAKDMSVYEDDADHFVNWLNQHAEQQYLEDGSPVARQFVPRILYRQYLSSLLDEIQQGENKNVSLKLMHAEVVDMQPVDQQVKLTLGDQQTFLMDKAILALGNNPPADFPFEVSGEVQCINNPWDYTALKNISADDPVLIVGTGLSMVDAVLTLHHQKHTGKIYALSRRGLLPLPHSESSMACSFDCASLPAQMRPLTKAVRAECEKTDSQGGDWRAIIHQMRLNLVDIWLGLNQRSKKQFLRHVLPYWNIHRHRVHEKLYALLKSLQEKGQMEVIAGRIQSVTNGSASVKLRKTSQTRELPIKHMINCMGSSFDYMIDKQPLLSALSKRKLISLDTLRLGLAVSSDYKLKAESGELVSSCYTIGPPMRGEIWECIAVPEIRKQCKELVQSLLSELSSAKTASKGSALT